MRIRFLYLILCCLSITSFAQSKRKYVEYGDTAFKYQDYGSAIYFYSKFIDKNFFEPKELTYAYDMQKGYLNSDTSSNTLSKRLKNRKNKKNNPVTPLPVTLASSPKISTESAGDSTAKTVPDNAKNLYYTSEFNRYQYVIHQLAEASRLNYDYENAETWYQRFLLYSTKTESLDRYWYACALMKNEKYDLALQEFKAFVKEYPDKKAPEYKKANKNMKSCTYATSKSSLNTKANVNELDSVINFGTSSFGVNYYGDSTIFVLAATLRDSSAPAGQDKSSFYTSDLYTISKNGNSWDPPKRLKSPINTKENEGTGVLLPDKNYFYFTQWSSDKKECAIYVSKFFNNEWRIPFKLNENVNVTGFKSMQPALTENGTLYFSSDRPGGKGKRDIWFCKIDETGNPGPAVNMDKEINTPEDEVSPFYHDYSNVLYFSSEGHSNLGGLDVFRSFYNIGENWSEATNLGKPVNSGKDDLYFTLQRDQRKGFLTSDRKKCADCNAGHCLQVYSVSQEPNIYSVKGAVFNAQTNEPIANSLITLKDVHDDTSPWFVITDANGKYYKELEGGIEFFLKAQKNKFFADAASVSTIGLSKSVNFDQDFFLAPIPDKDIVIPGIEYDYDKATLRPASEKILDTLVDFLNLNDNLYVEISSHTDNRGSDNYNFKLSEERAQSVVDYLISHSIDSGRLMPSGYGETRPLVPNAKTEEEHQKNRRTAFKTIKEEEIKVK